MMGRGISGAAGRMALALACSLVLAACVGGGGGGKIRYRPVSDVPVRVGPPYTIKGVTFVPAVDPAYDFLGYASWYGHESGSQTANGERFIPEWITAAHTTLPLPSYVEVTDLTTGRTILVRVNDRGPFINGSGRIIDLSHGAARQLGTLGRGVVPVRVRIANPPESDRNLRDQLRAGGY